MSKYYCLIAGLPDITLDDTKLTYSVAEFKDELEPILSTQDKKLTRLFFLKYDNSNLLSYLRKSSFSKFDERGNFSTEDIKGICDILRSKEKKTAKKSFPAYFTEFIKGYYSRFDEEEEIGEVKAPENNTLWDDKLSSSYYNEAMKCSNSFLSSWFEFNLNIGNVMAALNCREHGLDREIYIVGENEIAKQLRKTSSRDFVVENPSEYITELIHITEEKDLFMRERRLDVLRWNWLEDNILYKTFDIVSVLAYLLRLEMIERWIGLSKIRGEETFRGFVKNMKRGSSESLEKFKENNK